MFFLCSAFLILSPVMASDSADPDWGCRAIPESIDRSTDQVILESKGQPSPSDGNLYPPPVTVVCSRASPIIMTVTMAPTSVGLAAFGQYGVLLPPQLIPRDTMSGSVGLTTQPQQQQPQGPDAFLF